MLTSRMLRFFNGRSRGHERSTRGESARTAWRLNWGSRGQDRHLLFSPSHFDRRVDQNAQEGKCTPRLSELMIALLQESALSLLMVFLSAACGA